MEFVLKEVDKHPIDEGNFIGLINDRDETIQFVRFGRNEWLIDVTVLEGDTYAFLQDEHLKTEKVKEIV